MSGKGGGSTVKPQCFSEEGPEKLQSQSDSVVGQPVFNGD